MAHDSPAFLDTVQIEHIPSSSSLHIAHFTDVTNSGFLRQQLLQGNADYEYSFLDATKILSKTHLLAAAFRAINDRDAGAMKTHNIHAEIVFSLNPNNNIAESFRKFGIQDNTTSLLVVKVAPAESAQTIAAHLSSIVKGTPLVADPSNYSHLADIPEIRKLYKLKVKEQSRSRGEHLKDASDPSAGLDLVELQRLETSLLGGMALRGAT